MKTRVIELSINNRSEVIELPINPSSVEFTEKQMNQTVTLLNIGEVNLKGERGLKYTKFSSFFPSENSPHYRYAKYNPKKYVSVIEAWKTSKSVVRVIISDMGIDLQMLIDEFDYSMKEGDCDIYYSLAFSEHRTLNVPSVKIMTVRRPNTSASSGNKSHTVVKGDTLWGIAKKYYGNGAQYTKIYNANKNTIGGNPNRIYPGQVFMIPA